MTPAIKFAATTAAALALTASAASAQFVVDTFSRTTGSVTPPVSDWGNATSGQPYIVSTPSSESDVEYVADGTGRINFGRTILNSNLATPAAVAAGGIRISFQVNPTDLNDAIALGRDWAGIVLGDSNQTNTVGGSGYITGGNPNARIGLAPRNSGSLLSLVQPGGFRGTGNPNAGGFNEPVFDQATFNAYDAFVDAGNAGNGTEFDNEQFYTVALTVTETAAGNLFADGATLNFSVTINGAAVTLGQAPGGTLVWGDNDTQTGVAGATDTTPGVRDAYLVFVGNTGEHQFDNLSVSVVPEPATLGLASLAGLALLRRRRD